MNEPLMLPSPPQPATWILHPPGNLWGENYLAGMAVELHDDGLEARTAVELIWPTGDSQNDLISFFHSLARDWTGWPDVRHWRSMDAKLQIEARHDGIGHISLTAILRDDVSRSDGWQAQVTLWTEGRRTAKPARRGH
jgi:hypothetical protein